jgi:hypothetical protein
MRRTVPVPTLQASALRGGKTTPRGGSNARAIARILLPELAVEGKA